MSINEILPTAVTVQVTSLCNLECAHCAVESSRTTSGVWSEDMVDRLFSQLGERTPIIDMTGGEPLLAWDIVTKIGRESKKRGMPWGFTTNGTLLTDEHIDELLSLDVYGVKVSIEGLRQHHESIRGQNTFDKALDAINRLVEKGIKVGIQTAISQQNQNEIPQLIELFDKLGVTTYILFPLLPLGRQAASPEHLLKSQELKQFILQLNTQQTRNIKLFYELPQCASLVEKQPANEDALCAAGFMLHFTVTGDAWPCPVFPYVLGNIQSDSLNTLIDHRVVDDLRGRGNINSPCGDCESFSQCGGGCRAMAYMVHDDLHAADPSCWQENVQ